MNTVMLSSPALILAPVLFVACGSAATDDGGPVVSGEQWRVLVDDHQVGGPIDLGIHTATDADEYAQLWALLGRDGKQPDADLDDDVVVAYATPYPSGCEYPFLRLNVDDSNAVIEAGYAGNEPALCAADENQYLVMVSIDRDALTLPRYELTTSLDAQVEYLDL